MSYYVDRETAIGIIAPHDPVRTWAIRLTSRVPLIVERAALWGNVERLRRTLAGFGRPLQATNRFGRVEDFVLLEQTEEAFRRPCREPVERSSRLIAPAVDLLERGRDAGAKVWALRIGSTMTDSPTPCTSLRPPRARSARGLPPGRSRRVVGLVRLRTREKIQRCTAEHVGS